MNDREARRRVHTWAKRVVFLGLGLGLLFLLWPTIAFLYGYFVPEVKYLFRSLPSDEEMIANFCEHRQDFESLVHIYQEDLSVRTDVIGTLQPTPEIEVIMDRINVSVVKADGVIWMPPDPYSHDPKVREERSRLMGDPYFKPRARKFSGVVFYYAHPRVIRLSHGNDVWKGYRYFPCAPRIREGKVREPAHILKGPMWIADTLNRYPPNFGQFDSAYRQIEPHWFITIIQ